MNPLQKQKNYGIRSSYLNIGTRSGQYNVNRSNVKTLDQIQTDEIERIRRINPEFFNFFEVFQHPTLQELKTFDLKVYFNKTKNDSFISTKFEGCKIIKNIK